MLQCTPTFRAGWNVLRQAQDEVRGSGLGVTKKECHRYFSAQAVPLQTMTAGVQRVLEDRTRSVLRKWVWNKHRTKAGVSSRQCPPFKGAAPERVRPDGRAGTSPACAIAAALAPPGDRERPIAASEGPVSLMRFVA